MKPTLTLRKAKEASPKPNLKPWATYGDSSRQLPRINFNRELNIRMVIGYRLAGAFNITGASFPNTTLFMGVKRESALIALRGFPYKTFFKTLAGKDLRGVNKQVTDTGNRLKASFWEELHKGITLGDINKANTGTGGFYA